MIKGLFRKSLRKAKALFNKYIDYDIVGDYLDNNGKGYYKVKYKRRYKLRKRKK